MANANSINNHIASVSPNGYSFPIVDGTLNQMLTTNGSGTVSWGSFKVVIQSFTASGTYTPTAGMKYCIVEVVGGGGPSGLGSTVPFAAGGGGGGAYARSILTAATVGASQAVTIGTAGAGVTPGGTSSFGSLVVAGGGGLGTVTASGTAGAVLSGGTGGTATAGQVLVPGGNGGPAMATSTFLIGGIGGASYFGCGGRGSIAITSGSAAGGSASCFGSGGGGSVGFALVGAGIGRIGIVIITEFI